MLFCLVLGSPFHPALRRVESGTRLGENARSTESLERYSNYVDQTLSKDDGHDASGLRDPSYSRNNRT